MSTVDVSKIGTLWTDYRHQELSDPAESLGYLQFIANNDPDMMAISINDVLSACPHLAAIVIPRYAHLLKASDLDQLARFSEAASYIKEYQPELSLLLSA